MLIPPNKETSERTPPLGKNQRRPNGLRETSVTRASEGVARAKEPQSHARGLQRCVSSNACRVRAVWPSRANQSISETLGHTRTISAEEGIAVGGEDRCKSTGEGRN